MLGRLHRPELAIILYWPLHSWDRLLEMMMGKLSFVLAVVIAMLPGTGRAQEREDMTQVTCTNYLIMSRQTWLEPSLHG
jgi:hypothetical protein